MHYNGITVNGRFCEEVHALPKVHRTESAQLFRRTFSVNKAILLAFIPHVAAACSFIRELFKLGFHCHSHCAISKSLAPQRNLFTFYNYKDMH